MTQKIKKKYFHEFYSEFFTCKKNEKKIYRVKFKEFINYLWKKKQLFESEKSDILEARRKQKLLLYYQKQAGFDGIIDCISSWGKSKKGNPFTSNSSGHFAFAKIFIKIL